MAIFDTFSKRQKRLSAKPDVYQYEDIPQSLRVQAATLLMRCLGVESIEMYHTLPNKAWIELHQSLAEEFGHFQLPTFRFSHSKAVAEFMANNATTTEFLDTIDIAAHIAYRFHQDREWAETFEQSISTQQFVSDLNTRFRENAVGFRVLEEALAVIRVDSEHLHLDAVLPALQLLSSRAFEGADAEYRQAHHLYMRGNYKGCLNECLKAFESALKTICTKRKWSYRSGDAASKLIDVCIREGLFPSYMQNHLVALKALLETAIPTLRNKEGAHGQGEKVIEVPRFYAEYLLHETATTLVFLMSAFEGRD